MCFNPLALKFVAHSFQSIVNSDGFSFISNSDIDSNGDLVSEDELKNLKGSKVTGEDYDFDTIYYPYYVFLTDTEKQLYKQIYANADKIIETFIPIVDVNVQEVKKVFEAVYNDHPELFWVETSYSYKYTATNKCVQITLNFNETASDIDKYKEIFNSTVDKIVNGANKLSTDYEKEKYVHDVITSNVEYDKNASMNQSAYSALVNKKSICAGYSRAFQLIMIKLQIPTYYCVGVSTVNHAWNIVKLDDGYYNVDLTWDNSDITRYKYFNKTDNDFAITHTRTGLSLKLPKCNATKYRISNSTTTSNKVVSNVQNNSNTQSNSKEIISSEIITEDDTDEDLILEEVETEIIDDDLDIEYSEIENEEDIERVSYVERKDIRR